MTLSDDSLTSDERLLREIAQQSALIRNVQIVRSGTVFLSASAEHGVTRRPVFLTIARPQDMDARQQISVVTQMLLAVQDERIGVVIDLFWDERDKDSGWRCLVAPLHRELRPLKTALLSRTGEGYSTGVLEALRTAAKQLKSIHAAGFAHGDISMQNIGVDADGEVHLIDFEHVVGEGNRQRQRIAATPDFCHPDKLRAVEIGWADPKSHQTWDQYALGKVFLDTLAHLSPHSTPELTPRTQRAIRLLGALMLDGRNTKVELALGLTESFFVREHFGNLERVTEALDRLTNRVRPQDRIPELGFNATSVVELGGDRPVPFTVRVQSLLATPSMRALGDFNQLGLICFIWPTATHKRLEHAIGTFGLCVAIVRNLLIDPENPLFQIVVDVEMIKCLLLAALLHDVGHYPLAHDLEEAHHAAFEHERRSVRLIQEGEIAAVLSASEESGGWGVDPLDVASIINGRPLHGSRLSEEMCGLLHSVISGPIDADKLDYLRRDSERLNVRAGAGLDIERIIGSLTVATLPEQRSGLRLAVRAKSRRPAELVGRIRSHMFGVAYWHHSYRSIKAMIQWLVWTCMGDAGIDRDTPIKPTLLASRLYAELDRASSAGSWPARNPKGIPSRGALPIAEADILRWLVYSGTSEAKEMYLLLSRHQWYRVALSVEHPSSESLYSSQRATSEASTIWEGLARIYALPDDAHYLARLRLARAVQRHVKAWLSPLTEGEAGTIVYDFRSWKSRLLADDRQLFLVDGPDKTRAYQKHLYYTVDAKRENSQIDASKPLDVFRSFDDARLGDDFVATNGAVRLFVHPDYAAFVESGLDVKTLSKLLALSFREIVDSWDLSMG